MQLERVDRWVDEDGREFKSEAQADNWVEHSYFMERCRLFHVLPSVSRALLTRPKLYEQLIRDILGRKISRPDRWGTDWQNTGN